MTDKESANCRLEANYAHQQELDMIPLMMQVRRRLFLSSFLPPALPWAFILSSLSQTSTC